MTAVVQPYGVKKKQDKNLLVVTAVVQPQSVKNMSEINSVVTQSFKNWKPHQFCSDSDCYVITPERGHHMDG